MISWTVRSADPFAILSYLSDAAIGLRRVQIQPHPTQLAGHLVARTHEPGAQGRKVVERNQGLAPIARIAQLEPTKLLKKGLAHLTAEISDSNIDLTVVMTCAALE